MTKAKRKPTKAKAHKTAHPTPRDLNGYAMVSWNKDGDCKVYWAMGDTGPLVMPDKVRNAIIRVQVKHDLEDG